MDPNAARVALVAILGRARRFAERALQGDDTTEEMIEEIIRADDQFAALDKWLTDSGYLPEAWCGASAAPRPGRHAHAMLMPCGPGCPGYVEGRR